MRLSYQTITWGGVVGHPVGVTSIRDLFYLANGSTETAVRDIASAGYAGVEMFDGNLRQYEDRPDALRRLLDDSRMTLVAVYSGANFIYDDILEDEFWRLDKAATLGAMFGATNFVVGGGAQRSSGTTDQDYDALAAGLDRVTDLAERHGLRASYHPHLTTIVENPAQIDRIMAMSRIGFCPDTGHLAAGGGDPVALIRQHADRVTHVHLKDFTPKPFGFHPLGRGSVDVPGVLGALRDAGYERWATVELDEYDGPPGEAAAESFQYLQPLLAGNIS
jgi:inosose dehydratase